MTQTVLFIALLLTLPAISFSFIDAPLSKTETVNEIVPLLAKKSATAHDHAEEVSKVSSTIKDNLGISSNSLSINTLAVAVNGFLTLKEQGLLKNDKLLSIIDFSQSSRKKRFYVIDMDIKKMLLNTFVAHGKNSGFDKADNFSNTIGSEKSSLGFYVTKNTYKGKNGISLRLKGLDKGFNDNAEARAIVIHGADYVSADRVQSAYMGRSQGCPALSRQDYLNVIDLIKDGAALFVYSGDASYLASSTVLNPGA